MKRLRVFWRPAVLTPLVAGGSDWFGLRVWPMWIEWQRTTRRAFVKNAGGIVK